MFRDGDSSGLPTTPKNMGSKDKDEEPDCIAQCLGFLCAIAFCGPAFVIVTVIYVFYEISMAVASAI